MFFKKKVGTEWEGRGRGGRALSPFLGSPCLPPSLPLVLCPTFPLAPGLALLWLCACSSACSAAGHWQGFANPTKREGERTWGALLLERVCVCACGSVSVGVYQGWVFSNAGIASQRYAVLQHQLHECSVRWLLWLDTGSQPMEDKGNPSVWHFQSF